MEADTRLASDGKVVAQLPVPGAQRMAGFDRLRKQLETRRQLQTSSLSRSIAEVDIEEFTLEPQHGADGSNICEFNLRGALPPTVSQKRDVSVWTAIGRAEAQAAKELIERNKAEEKARIDALAKSVRASRTREEIAKENLRPKSTGRGISQRRPSGAGDSVEYAQESSVESVAVMQNLSSQSAPATSSNSVMPCAPGAHSWESRITDFYRRWEDHRNEERAVDVKCKMQEEHEQQCKHVHRIHFERNHNRRIDHIINEASRFDVAILNREYKQSLKDEFVRQESARREAKTEQYERARSRVEKSRAAKETRELANSFIAQQSSIAKTCTSLDLWKHKLHKKARAAANAEFMKEERAASSRRHAAQRVLAEAQKRKVDGQMERKDRYLIKISGDATEARAQAVRDRVSAELNLKRHLKQKRGELQLIESGEGHEAGEDVANYEHTLAALRDLAIGVRERGEIMKGLTPSPEPPASEADLESKEVGPPAMQPLLEAEPRIKAMLANGALGRASPVDFGFEDLDENDSWDAHDDFIRDDIDQTPWPESCAPCTSQQSTVHSARERRELHSPQTPRTPGKPCGRKSAPSPLLVRPLVDIRQQIDQTTMMMRPQTTPAKPPRLEKVRGDNIDNLVALRKIRRTGPLVKR